MPDQTSGQSVRNRLIKVFEFLKAYTELRYPPVRDIDQQLRVLWIKDLPPHHSVEIFQQTGEENDSLEDADVILRITRATLASCPLPPTALERWLKPGWQEIDGRVEIYVSVTCESGDTTGTERFEEQPERTSLLAKWQQEREEWRVNERPARQALAIFQTIYEWFGIYEREAERVEILLGDGLLSCSHDQGSFNHPILLQKVQLEFYPEKRLPQFVFRKRDQPAQLYLEFLRALPDVNHRQIVRCAEELKKTEVSPLGADTDGFLRRLIQGLFPTGGNFVDSLSGVTGKGPTIRREPVIFIRQRQSGTANVFDLVLEDIAERSEFPIGLLHIVGCTVDAQVTPNGGVDPRVLGNEDEEVLLSKPANREQLQIAKQLGRQDCVLVQGPPGTGKTHTIANLLGHLLAQGKRVLVTAHTPKALKVLREKVVEPLQSLCISILQNDKQSQEELQQSVRQIHARLSQDDQQLEREADYLQRQRKVILGKLSESRTHLLKARQDELRTIVFGGQDCRPIEAAKRVKAGCGVDDWIPSPVKLGESLPLSHAQVVALYQSNARITLEDERQLNGSRPDLATLPTPKQFYEFAKELHSLRESDLHYREELWDGERETQDLAEFDRMLSLAVIAIEFLRDSRSWQLEAVQAGRDGRPAKQVWISLCELIESIWKELQECNGLVMAHGPQINDTRPPHELLPIVDEIIRHIESGKSFGLLTRLTKPACHEVITVVRIGSQSPSLETPLHFRAVRALLRTQIARQKLVDRWERQITAQGGPAAEELGDKPEQVCRQFVTMIQTSLDWHESTWRPLEADFGRVGFRWSRYFESTPPEMGANAELRRLRKAVLGDLERILQARAGCLRLKTIESCWAEWRNRVPETDLDVVLTHSLRQSIVDVDPDGYERAYNDLVRLKNLEPDLLMRRSLVDRLQRSAPAWASAIQNRLLLHAGSEPPGNPEAAWEWRQLHDELEARAKVSLDEIQRRIEQLNVELLDVTSQLIEKLTWANLIRKTTLEQKQALGAYAAMRNKLTKTGKGVRDAELRAAARQEMAVAKGAVPVWIMPLNEVAESFDPRTTRFDAVIIDEASQCDAEAMLALYLGKQTIIVGDDEQVTPVAVGVEMEEVQKLIQVHLDGVPHKELYDGEFSIYEFAQIAFGGVIRLVEHFRCAPNIIAFSNAVSYKGEIKPLREASAIRLNPHVVPYRVDSSHEKNESFNETEAETIASLICAAVEHPDYGKNGTDKPVTFGVVSLVGDQQAMRVDALLREHLEPAEYKSRQILCGAAAQFQGDERDVIFLSVVDSPPAAPPLPMRQEGPKRIFKKRFNVAASRARDQMWVVHSLNHDVDLKVGDYRRRLIEHAIDPEAWERELQKQLQRTESVFEQRVLKILLAANYVVLPQYRVGAYRIDLVIAGGGKRLAVECDGERYHGPEKLQEDVDRQAILERLGWRFVRVRGSVFFRDEERAMRPVFQRLTELGITPDLEITTSSNLPTSDRSKEEVIRRAQELRALWREGKRSSTEA